LELEFEFAFEFEFKDMIEEESVHSGSPTRGEPEQ
jgi:hypothetical protein